MLLLAESAGQGSVTGVDVNEHRLNVTRNVLRKYGAQRVRLFLASGECFMVLAPVRRTRSLFVFRFLQSAAFRRGETTSC